ncbi:hypothetical protein BGZ80_005467, partial [Entomortierella chlamydospora]
MPQNPFSSRTIGLSLEDALELANEYLGNARKESDTAKALELTSDAKSLLKEAEKIFASKKVKDPALGESIANTYHKHGKLLEELGYHDKAKKSHSKAEGWGYVNIVSQRTGSPHPLGEGDTSSKTDADVKLVNHQHHTSAKVNNGRPSTNKDVVHIPQKIFDQNITPPITKYALPEPNGRITTTPQLAYCLSLLRPSMMSKGELDQSECDWLQSKVVDPDEQERLQTMATDLIRAFVREEFKKPGVIAEVVSLGAVLGQDDFRKLLQAFVDSINQSVLLNVHLLNGLAQLIRNAAQGYIDVDDLIKILELLNSHLKDTHKQSTQHTYQLALTISH